MMCEYDVTIVFDQFEINCSITFFNMVHVMIIFWVVIFSFAISFSLDVEEKKAN